MVDKSDDGMKISARIRGIGLFEACLFLIALGVMIIPATAIYNQYRDRQRLDITNANMAQVQSALDTFYLNKGFFPCPAPRNVPVDNADFGKAVTGCGTGTPAGTASAPSTRTVTVPTGTPTPPPIAGVSIGALPVRTLGLPDNMSLDGWNHLLVYAVTKDYTTLATSHKNLLYGGISVVDSAGNTATAYPSVGVYIVATSNPDGSGAYRMTGTLEAPCPATGLAAINCNDDSTFLSTLLLPSTSWHPPAPAFTMKADACADPAGGLPIDGVCGPAHGGTYPTICPPAQSTLCAPGSESSPLNGAWSWNCKGKCLGKTVSCSATTCAPVDGVCGASDGQAYPTTHPPDSLCAVGSASPLLGKWGWVCTGTCCGGSVGCSASLCTPVNAVCGSDNGGTFSSTPTHLCTRGSPSAVAGSGPWTWSCTGGCYGTTVNCSASYQPTPPPPPPVVPPIPDPPPVPQPTPTLRGYWRCIPGIICPTKDPLSCGTGVGGNCPGPASMGNPPGTTWGIPGSGTNIPSPWPPTCDYTVQTPGKINDDGPTELQCWKY